MKNILLFISFFFLCSVNIFAQAPKPKGPDHDKAQIVKDIENFKLKFLAQEMDLKENQQEQFFKLYKEYSEKKKECYKPLNKLKKKIKEIPEASDKEYKDLRETEEETNQKLTALDKEYDEKFREFLSEKQLYKMKEAELEFQSKINVMRHNKRSKSHNGPRPMSN